MTDRKPLPSVSPESKGLSCKSITAFVQRLRRLNMHSYMLLRDGLVLSEGYWKPFDARSGHRMYSVSKTFTSAAIGALCGEGRISLSDPVAKYFPDMLPEKPHPFILSMTIRDLLIMATPFTQPTYSPNRRDWTKSFFTTAPSHPAGTVFAYDTSGTFILDALIERVTGMPFLEYLKDKAFRKMGMSEEMWCVKSPDGYSWGGSGVICTTADLAKFAQLFLNGGEWEGEQLLPRDYIQAATSIQIDNNTSGAVNCSTDGYGYGYKVWMTRDGSWSFLGMGDQLAVVVPDKRFIFVCTADNQGNDGSRHEIYDALWEEIIGKLSDSPLPEDKEGTETLHRLNSALEPNPQSGALTSVYAEKVNGTDYKIESGMSRSKLIFKDGGGIWEHSFGDETRRIEFGIGCFREGEFPNRNYFGESIGFPKGKGYRYIASGAWTEEHKFVLRLYVIDDYFGNLTVTFSFKDDYVALRMIKTAEWFLDEYQGFTCGVIE